MNILGWVLGSIMCAGIVVLIVAFIRFMWLTR